MARTLTSWIARIAVAAMFIFTGLFKLSGNPEAQETFAQLGGAGAMYLTGVAELVGAVLILLPKTRAIGGVWAASIMSGAIVSHVANLVPNHDMLPLAVVLFAAGVVVAVLHRAELPVVGEKLAAASSPATA